MVGERDRYEELWRETLQALKEQMMTCKRPMDAVIIQGIIVNMLMLRDMARQLQLIEGIMRKFVE